MKTVKDYVGWYALWIVLWLGALKMPGLLPLVPITVFYVGMRLRGIRWEPVKK